MNEKNIDARYTEFKMVTIESLGRIPRLGLNGPIKTPFKIDTGVLYSIVRAGKDVYEHVDGKKIKMTLANYKDNYYWKNSPASISNREKVKRRLDKEVKEAEENLKAMPLNSSNNNKKNK